MKKTNISLGGATHRLFCSIKEDKRYMLDIYICFQQTFWLITLLITFLFK